MQCIVPIMTYASETWIITKKLESKIRPAQMQMERKLLGVRWEEKRTKASIKEETKLPDVLQRIKSSKRSWAGHVARALAKENWYDSIRDWKPSGRRSRGRPKKRWIDYIRRYARTNWIDRAQDRDQWQELREAYVQQ